MELYAPRTVTEHGHWEIAGFRAKVYGLSASDGPLNETVLEEARTFLESDLPGRIAAQGNSDGLGFVIVHAGTAGVTISAYWWVMGSVLCQTLNRTLPSGDAAYASDNPVVGCVWELGLVEAERRIWMETQMTPGTDPERYLEQWAGVATV